MPKDSHRSTPSLQETGDQSSLGFEPRVAQLRALVAVAREASYTRAARYLSYTESAVFLQIKALERLAGIPLVERSGAGISLTLAGDVVHRYALRVIEDVETMGRELAGVKGNLPVVVGGGRSTAVYYLTPLIAAFSRAHPEYQVELNIMPAEDLVSGVEDGIFDIAASGGVGHVLASGHAPKTDLRYTAWFRGGWAIVTPRDEPLLDRQKPLYVPEFAAFIRPEISRVVDSMIGAVPTMVVLASGDAVKGAVIHGLGSAILPASAVRMEAELGLVCVQPIKLRDDVVMLMHRRPRLLTAGARELLRHLVAARRTLAPRNALPN